MKDARVTPMLKATGGWPGLSVNLSTQHGEPAENQGREKGCPEPDEPVPEESRQRPMWQYKHKTLFDNKQADNADGCLDHSRQNTGPGIEGDTLPRHECPDEET